MSIEIRQLSSNDLESYKISKNILEIVNCYGLKQFFTLRDLRMAELRKESDEKWAVYLYYPDTTRNVEDYSVVRPSFHEDAISIFEKLKLALEG